MSTARIYSRELPMRATSRRQPRVLADSASSHCARKAQISKPSSISGAKTAKDAALVAKPESHFFALEMSAATHRAARDATNLLTATPDEAAIIIAAALIDPRDLLRLAAACRRFALKCIAAPWAPRFAVFSGDAAAAAAAESWSIAEEVARRWIADCIKQERGWVPRRARESWLGLMWEVQSLRRGAVFGRSHEDITLSEGGSRAAVRTGMAYCPAVASKVVMRAGRHYAQFTVLDGRQVSFGVIRPGWDVEGGCSADSVDGHCFYCMAYGRHCCRWPRCSWKGMQGAKKGDRIGMLLDLDQGSMTVYKNDERLGVMATGLSGKYCWGVGLVAEGNSVRIEDTAVLPASPTPHELAQAVAWAGFPDLD
jgi:hypothetical protein